MSLEPAVAAGAARGSCCDDPGLVAAAPVPVPPPRRLCCRAPVPWEGAWLYRRGVALPPRRGRGLSPSGADGGAARVALVLRRPRFVRCRLLHPPVGSAQGERKGGEYGRGTAFGGTASGSEGSGNGCPVGAGGGQARGGGRRPWGPGTRQWGGGGRLWGTVVKGEGRGDRAEGRRGGRVPACEGTGVGQRVLGSSGCRP